MALRRNLRLRTPLTIVNLNADCLFQIFSYLQLPDLLNIRLQCSSLNDVVCKFLPYLTKLSIVYTEYDPTEKAYYKPAPYYEPTLMSVNDWIDFTFQDLTQNHIQQKDFIVVSGQQKLERFLEFLKKYEIKSIKQLALINDCDRANFLAASETTDLLELCPKVETLFLERTNRHDWILRGFGFNDEDIKRFLITIAELISLRELHFFARQHSKICLTFNREPNVTKVEDRIMTGNFLSTMFRKLRIFRINHETHRLGNTKRDYLSALLGQTFDLLELSLQFGDFARLIFHKTKFPNLRSLTLLDDYVSCAFRESMIGDSLEQLRSLYFSGKLDLWKETIANLNALPNLEKLSAESIQVDVKENHVFNSFNNTIKHIQLKYVKREVAENDNFDDDFQNRKSYALTYIFKSLLTVTVFLPEVVVYEGDTINDIRVGKMGYT